MVAHPLFHSLLHDMSIQGYNNSFCSCMCLVMNIARYPPTNIKGVELWLYIHVLVAELNMQQRKFSAQGGMQP